MNFWLIIALKLFAGALVCGVIALFFNPWFGLGAACVGLLLALASHWIVLNRLQRWVLSPKTDEIPDAGGTWGSVLASLYRAQRQEENSRAELSAGLDRFRQAASALPDGVILLDAEDRIEWFNPAASSQFGFDIQRDCGTLAIHLIRQPEFIRYVREEDYHEAVILHSPSGDGRVYSVQMIPFAVGGHIVLSRDITSSEKAETVRRDFIANVSHEMRTPLTVIQGLVEHLVDSDDGADPVRRHFLGMLRDQSGHMNRLVEDLLTLSRLEAGSPGLREESVDVAAMVRSLVDEAETLSGGRHTFELELSAGSLRGIAIDLRSAFGNLINNAVRYSPDGGPVRIRWGMVDSHPEFRVEDRGVGIAAEHLPRLTERFYRVDKGRSSETGGTGLGLAIVKHSLLKHQARLQISSEPGQGSVFRAVFPLNRWSEPPSVEQNQPVAA